MMGGGRSSYAAYSVVVIVVVGGAGGYSSSLLLSLMSISDDNLPCPLSSSSRGSICPLPITRPRLSSSIICNAVGAVVAPLNDGICPWIIVFAPLVGLYLSSSLSKIT
jgi:hypothetical protein